MLRGVDDGVRERRGENKDVNEIRQEAEIYNVWRAEAGQGRGGGES